MMPDVSLSVSEEEHLVTDFSVFHYRVHNWPEYNHALINRGRLTVRNLDTQRTEAQVKCSVLNRMTQFGMPETVRRDDQCPQREELLVIFQIIHKADDWFSHGVVLRKRSKAKIKWELPNPPLPREERRLGARLLIQNLLLLEFGNLLRGVAEDVAHDLVSVLPKKRRWRPHVVWRMGKDPRNAGVGAHANFWMS